MIDPGRRWPERVTERNALLMDAPIKSSMEECASGMGRSKNYAAVMDALIYPSTEECALGMEQRSNYAAVMDAQMYPS